MKLMGRDGAGREVLESFPSHGEVFVIVPRRGDPWICSSATRFPVLSGHKKGQDTREEIIVNPREFSSLSANKRRNSYFRRVGFDLPEKVQVIDPYIIGQWIGDGTKGVPLISMHIDDVESREYIENWASEHGYDVVKQSRTRNGVSVRLNGGRGNDLLKTIRKCVVEGEKAIPQEYELGSIPQRLSLLAGLLDSDGHLTPTNTFVLAVAPERLALQIAKIVQSCGLWCNIEVRTHVNKVSGRDESYHRLYISGGIEAIPTLVQRKKARKRNPDARAHDVTRVQLFPFGKRDFVAIEVDGDGMVLLEDGTVICLGAPTKKALDLLVADSAAESLAYVL